MCDTGAQRGANVKNFHTTTQRGNIKCRRVIVQECQEIPPRTQMNVTARRTLLSTRDVHRDVMVESHELKPGVYVGRTLVSNRTSRSESVYGKHDE